MIRILLPLAALLLLGACVKAITSSNPHQSLGNLAGSEWAPANNPSDQFVAFKSGGEVIGSGGCNNFFGTFETAGDALTFGPLASTKKMCPPAIMDAETLLLTTLQNTRRFEASHLKLTLFNDSGETLMTLQRRDWD